MSSFLGVNRFARTFSIRMYWWLLFQIFSHCIGYSNEENNLIAGKIALKTMTLNFRFVFSIASYQINSYSLLS